MMGSSFEVAGRRASTTDGAEGMLAAVTVPWRSPRALNENRGEPPRWNFPIQEVAASTNEISSLLSS